MATIRLKTTLNFRIFIIKQSQIQVIIGTNINVKCKDMQLFTIIRKIFAENIRRPLAN
jgi:phosphotransferase system IIB component